MSHLLLKDLLLKFAYKTVNLLEVIVKPICTCIVDNIIFVLQLQLSDNIILYIVIILVAVF